MSQAFKNTARLSLLGYAGILCLIIFAHLNLLNTNFPFELFSSYSRHFLLALIFVIPTAIWARRGALIPLIILAGFAFWPLLSFSKYVTPSGETCTQTQHCLTVISANLQGNLDALHRTSLLAAQSEADLVTLLEIPAGAEIGQLQAEFSSLPYINILASHPDGSPRRMRLAVLSRYPLGTVDSPSAGPAVELSGPRFISTYMHVPGAQPLQVIAVHPYPPMSPPMAWGRDQTLGEAAAAKTSSENFIMLGDFNTTPWTPAFKALPGKRAGDPRFISTWDATRPWLGIPIDHILVGNDIEALHADIGSPTGSDHRPLTATIRIK